jgi:hypothetical protein
MRRFTLVLTVVFFIGQPAVYAQVNTERHAINSLFFTYQDTGQLEAGMLSIGQYASFAHAAAGDSLSAPGIEFELGLTGGWNYRGFEQSGLAR